MRQIPTVQHCPVGIHVGRAHWQRVVRHVRRQVRIYFPRLLIISYL